MQKNKFLKNQSTYIKGITLVFLGAVCFSTKAIFAKLAFKYGVDGITILMIRMLFYFLKTIKNQYAYHKKPGRQF